MRLVLLTPETFPACEAEALRRMAEASHETVLHLRKPGAPEGRLRELLDRLPPELYPRIVLHDHHRLALEYGLGGIHLNRRAPQPPAGWHGHVGRSCHSLEEVLRRTAEDELFLSPIYDSISKRGYGAAFPPGELEAAAASGLLTPRLTALGGVTPERLPELARLGFGGAAFLGYVWGEPTLPFILKRFDTILCCNSSLTAPTATTSCRELPRR